MNQETFWSMIEDAWNSVGGKVQQRQRIAHGDLDDDEVNELMEELVIVIPTLEESLENLKKDDLLEFDRILEKKLYEIDRADVHERTAGGDDGFLCTRGALSWLWAGRTTTR